MSNDELMPIGAFARRSGLTSSALRFYADSGLLPPAEVDPVSGYRYYSADQVARATVLRQLRELAMPLAAVEAVLGSGADEASRLLDEHVAKVVEDAASVQQKAAVIKSALGNVPGFPIAVMKGPVLADAVEQVLTATAQEPGMPALAGLRIEARQEAVTLTATDRYRLSTRTLVPAEPPSRTWAGTVNGDELRAAVAVSRRSPLVRLEAVSNGLWFRVADREDRHCRLLPEEFPDYRLMLASLGEVSTRATVSKNLLLRALEEQSGERVALHVADHGVNVVSADDEHPSIPLPATATGQALQIWFELTTLHPAVSTAIGPDVMLDLRGHDQPATIRSADRGDLTTLAMPVKPDPCA
ncbi:MerR family transcriptional regulator [Streptomyces cyaneochromogenes]|uniref:MerR family transcriptional regulator n=1 Tax=Streptomyces cyaneochromogenes TaxID=2496836 RepID=A0A3S9LZE6_9ACTN|nr:MerR family transcriptional regulator [Streptomyces cyaneochromogenes]AZQ32276.1 MerR family transcriptional regulator [Streptomyces cyaneochromogenes]